MTNRDKLIALGVALHGPLWQNAVARDLGVNPRQVHRWVSGEYAPPPGVISDLLKLARERSFEITQAVRKCT